MHVFAACGRSQELADGEASYWCDGDSEYQNLIQKANPEDATNSLTLININTTKLFAYKLVTVPCMFIIMLTTHLAQMPRLIM